MAQSNINKYLPKLQEISLNISQIECKTYVWQVPKTQYLAGLIVFSGTYLYGSAGCDDALFIKWRLNEFCELNSPHTISGLVVDLRNLDYQWGDDLTIEPEQLRRFNQPVRVVVTPERYTTFSYVVNTTELITDMELAFAEVKNILQAI
jgi:hypothetical protein